MVHLKLPHPGAGFRIAVPRTSQSRVLSLAANNPRASVRLFSQDAHRSATLADHVSYDEGPPPLVRGGKPSVVGPVPGIRAQRMKADLDRVFDTRSVNMIVDYEKSHGNLYACPARRGLTLEI